ncbi:MAG TPA: inosine monophosphate cyclohydrolase [Clostridiaceae bacterium]|jgi:IMP cyclohydrolase|nr:inosine monophosphate cyclohydrolase [Clostridiaceae bacterium]
MTCMEIVKKNMNRLAQNSYPGRGIIIGMSPDSKNMIQVYWIMGRSENSRNRVFIEENGNVKIEAYDPARLKDPSLVIYYPVRQYENKHIVTNGDQTDTIYNFLKEKTGTFEDALDTRTFEPDAPNFTPRISGLIDLDDKNTLYRLSILKSLDNNPDITKRFYFKYSKALPGAGHLIHTYESDGNPLPSFEGEPYMVELFNNIDQVADFYWNLLNEENRVSLLVKFINLETKKSVIKIVNKHK